MKKIIKIPVRVLAEYVFKTGSIESGFNGFPKEVSHPQGMGRAKAQ